MISTLVVVLTTRSSLLVGMRFVGLWLYQRRLNLRWSLC